MDTETREYLEKMTAEVCQAEKEYMNKKHELDLLKAQYTLKKDWEQTIGKPKPTVDEKKAHISIALKDKEAEVNDLKITWEYKRKILEINILAQKY